ncbi:MAG: hypothetical protein H6812_02030 [Phycisphaeraceae bacterium]|nr:hypothetical protein [Phycisphaerales bacterium]MCB9842016.1 hypothetical protein [Phycisphaeraceae bacterium]
MRPPKRRRTRLILRRAGIVILTMWGLSYWRAYGFIWNPPGNTSGADRLMADYGRLYILQNIGGPGGTGFHVAAPNKPGFLDQLPFAGRLETPMQGQPWRITVPPVVCVLTGLVLLGCSFHTPRYKRMPKWFPAGCCQSCGYDLTGIEDRCPECGHIKGEPVST